MCSVVIDNLNDQCGLPQTIGGGSRDPGTSMTFELESVHDIVYSC